MRLPQSAYRTGLSGQCRPMSHKGRYDNLVVLAKGALNFLSSQLFAEKGITEAYMTIKEDLKDVSHTDWDKEQMRRYIKPTHRLMVEVY
jgi:hypothetical protein